MGLRKNSNPEYDKDFFKWSKTQAKFLKNKEFDKLDYENLIEELEALGRSEKRALKSYLKILLMHMLKFLYQPDLRSRSWELSIVNSRNEFKEVLDDNPSLQPKLQEIADLAYKSARLDAARETGISLKTFPEKCPWTKEQIFDDNFFGE